MHIHAKTSRFLKIAHPLTATLADTGGLVLSSWSAMRHAEREGAELKR